MVFLKKKNKPSHEKVDAPYLEASHPAFKELFDNAKYAMLATYNDGAAYCYVNNSACEITGYNFGELMNLGFKDLVHPEELCKIEGRLEQRRKI